MNVRNMLGFYPCGDGEQTLTYRNTSVAERDEYLATLEKEEFAQVFFHRIAGNQFHTYYKDNRGVHLCYYPSKKLFKIVTVTAGYEPVTERPDVAAAVTPSVTQLGREGASFIAPGMSYAMQTSDGGFILVDGGPGQDTYQADWENLYAWLKERTPDGKKPVIHAWFFTHAHGDHMQLATRFLEIYHDDIALELVCANFPDPTAMTDLRVPAEIGDLQYYPSRIASLLKDYYPQAETLKIHTGQAFWLADAYIEILFTHEDYYPEPMEWGNDTSSAFRVTLGGKQIIFLGDCDPKLCQFISDVYGETLKCDILQLSHHGFNGAVLDLYQNCDPEVCFWPVDGERFATDERCLGTQKHYEFNAWLRDPAVKERRHYHSSETTTIEL